jgi:hypothetical protein
MMLMRREMIVGLTGLLAAPEVTQNDAIKSPIFIRQVTYCQMNLDYPLSATVDYSDGTQVTYTHERDLAYIGARVKHQLTSDNWSYPPISSRGLF